MSILTRFDVCLLHYEPTSSYFSCVDIICIATDHRRSRHGYLAIGFGGCCTSYIPRHTSHEDQPRLSIIVNPAGRVSNPRRRVFFLSFSSLQILSTSFNHININMVRKCMQPHLEKGFRSACQEQKALAGGDPFHP